MNEAGRKRLFNLSEELNSLDLTRSDLKSFRDEWESDPKISDEQVILDIKKMAMNLDGENAAMRVILNTNRQLGVALAKVQTSMKNG